ncbi:phosphoribosylamine--glycine ligase [Ectothiorhodospira lacustris]|uniref:phosphoribosylamine--glycine ligase n=1 Tax=Ectothiorhodospira lacustris TaxID=2899127 RepID=UPI001EE8CA71|nr:phosphoribosylamine--glycine ligase [Ectothiorhodospira lacustris]MCG5501427.1 phosphoribosylamine--glycine ligase [Ectothiorhodospira lacustris]MCG5508908.1 phosphoribosylamine--glycine ligase [Ectothiorhodospira lacustris]MCG5520699.1 phosphoribosylamine--glycine ligase [Ectothiorhodospira lacustris]
MKILIIGGGGREHALAWKAARSPRVETVFVAPGNAGTAREAGCRNVDIGAEDIPGLLAFARTEGIDLTIVGPEAPLVAGVVDAFRAEDLAIFGPSKDAARLEGSKAFSKDFLARHRIPTAAYGSFTDLDEALAYLRAQGAPIVVKADGLAAGKGVILARTLAEAEAAVRDMLAGNAFGEAGHRVVIEEFLSGEEASFICMVDGEHVLPMATSQDHKARDNGDQGPNTGGMGAYSPAPVVTPEIHARIMSQVILPTVRGMAAEGTPYTGFLYAGVMIDAQGIPKVLEFNCRFGDPETQPILMRLRSDLIELLEAALAGRLDRTEADWDPRAALGVVLAAGGYPADYRKGDEIRGLPDTDAEDAKVFHAGTALRDDRVVTQGGRVLCAVGLGERVSDAQARAYALTKQLSWDDVYYRTDIGYRAVARE